MRKICTLLLVLCLLVGVLPVSAETVQTVWDGFDANAVISGTSDYWSQNYMDVYSYDNLTGIIAPAGNGSMTSTDPIFPAETTKREWGKMIAKNSITSADATKYEISFDMTSVEGAYAAKQGGCYIVLRSDSFANYLDNRFMIIIKRNQSGTTKIALKSANQGVNSGELDITNENITLLDASVKVVDNFNSNIVKVYVTDTNGDYQCVGNVKLDPETNSATLTNASGDVQTRTGYANAISASATTPGFMLAETSTVISNVKVTYPLPGPVGVAVSHKSGIYAGCPNVELSTPDESGVIYYTTDGSDPIENGIEYNGENVDFGELTLPATVELKVTEMLDEEYSDVESYTYTIYPENDSRTLNVTEVAGKTSEDFSYTNAFYPASLEIENDGFTTEDKIHSWSHVYSNFKIPVAAGGMEYNFKMHDLGYEGALLYGVYVSLSAAATENMTSKTIPYLYLNRMGIGFRKGENWGPSNAEIIGYGDGINVDLGTYDVRIVNRFGGISEVYFGNQLVATCTIEDGTFTITNTDGESISRTGVTVAEDYAYTNIALYRGATTTTIADYTISYPASDVLYAAAEIEEESVEAYLGEEVTIDVNCNNENATIYYTTDGTLPNADSNVCDGEITLESLDTAEEMTVTVRAFDGTYWGTTDKVTVTYKALGNVTISPESGEVMGKPEITLTSPDGVADIYYTLDGSDPANIDTAIKYTEAGVDLSEITAETFEIKAVAYAYGCYGAVTSATYKIVPAEATYVLNPAEVSEKTSADFDYKNAFYPTSFENENDGFTTEDKIHSWSQVCSKFRIPVEAGGMEYNFKMSGLGLEGGMLYGVFVSLSAPTTDNMTSKTVPYLYLNQKGLGFRTNENWGATATSQILEYGDGIKIDEGTYNVRIVNRFDGVSEVYFGNQLVATCTIEDGTFTITNTDGESISRTGVIAAEDYVYTNIALYRGTYTITIADYTISYPANEVPYADVEIEEENIEAYLGEDVAVDVHCNNENATIYYTTDGTLPNADSNVCDGEIVIESPDTAGELTVTVRAFDGAYWGTTDKVKVTYKELSAVTITPASCTSAGMPEITLTSPDGVAEIYYTLDGSDPANLETAIKYTEAGIDLSGITAESFEIKAVAYANGYYSAVASAIYTIVPENATYVLNPADVSEKTSADFEYNNQFVVGTVDKEGDAFTTNNTINSWTHVYSKFAVPANAGGMEYRFKVNDLSMDGATHYGMFISLQAAECKNMVSNTTPYLYLGRTKIGFRNSGNWGAGATTTIAYADGIKIDEGTHEVRIVNVFNGLSKVYVDKVLVATVEIKDGTMTVYNTAGESISRDGIAESKGGVFANIAIYKGTYLTSVADFTVVYPVVDAEYPTVEIASEIPELEVGDELTLAVTASDNATVYYTLDGTEPDTESAVYSEGIEIPSPEAEGTVTVKVRAYANGLWGKTKTVELVYNKKILRGDTDGDGKVTVYDAVYVLKMVAEIVEITEDSAKAADVNGNGVTDVSDATAILRYIARISYTL